MKLDTPSRFAAVIVAMLATTLLASELSDRRAGEELDSPLESLPIEIGNWNGTELGRLNEATEQVLKASAYLSRSYHQGDREMGFFIAFYAMQQAGETMHSPKHCLPGTGWEIWDYESVELPMDDGVATINKYYIQSGRNRQIVYYWYQTKDRVIASEYYAKICMVADAVLKGRTAGSIVRMTMPDAPWAHEEGPAFAASVIPLVRDRLPGQR